MIFSHRVILPLLLVVGVGGYFSARSHSPMPSLTVEVLNGTRQPRLAWRTALWLRERGVDVWYYGNIREDTVRRTFILAVSSERTGADRLARALPCRPPVEHAPDPSRVVDVVIVLGEDAPRCFPGVEKIPLRY